MFTSSPFRSRQLSSVLRCPIALLLAVTLAVLTAAPAGAEAAARNNGIDYTKPYIDDRLIYSPPCGHFISNADSKRDYQRALHCARDRLSGDLTPDERAVLLRFAAQLEMELGNFRQAIRDIEASFETGVLTDVEKAENYFFLGRLYLGVEPPDYGKSILNLNKYIESAEKPDPNAYFYLGQALALTERCKEALPHAEKAIELAEKPKESYHRLLLFCHTELGEHAQVISLTERIIEQFGVKDEYLQQRAIAQRALGRDKDAFLTEAQRYELGFLTEEAEIIGLAELYLAHGNPHRAARILDREMKAGRVKRTAENLEKLGNMWFLARDYEKAREALAEAARLRDPDTDNCDFRTGCHPYFNESPEDWKAREQKLRRARAEVKKILVRARRADLTADQRKLLQGLDETSKRRVEALEQAQADLKKAAKVAEQARAALTAPSPPRGEAGH